MLAVLTLFLPLIGFIISSFFGKKFNDKLSQYTTSFLLVLALLIMWNNEKPGK